MIKYPILVHDSELSSKSSCSPFVLKTAGSVTASADAPGVSRSKFMLGTTVDGVSIDTPSTFVSVSESGSLRGSGIDVEVTTGGSMRWVILAAAAEATGEA